MATCVLWVVDSLDGSKWSLDFKISRESCAKVVVGETLGSESPSGLALARLRLAPDARDAFPFRAGLSRPAKSKVTLVFSIGLCDELSARLC